MPADIQLKEIYKLHKKDDKVFMFIYKLGQVSIYVFLILSALVLILPLIWLFICALTPEAYLSQMPPKIKFSNFSFYNFKTLFSVTPLFGIWFLNTLYVSLIITILSLFLNSLAGYSFAKFKFKGRTFLFWLLLSTLMVPAQLTVIPIFIIFANILQLKDTHLAIILPQLSAPIGIFLMKQYIQSLPSDLEDSARIDGCGEFGIYLNIIVPLSKPILVIWAIIVFIANWQNFFWPLIILESERKFLIEVGLSTLQKQFTVNQGLVMAGAAIATIPILIMFLCFQKQISYGVVLGEIK